MPQGLPPGKLVALVVAPVHRGNTMILQALLLLCPSDVVYINPQSSSTSGYRDFGSPYGAWSQKISINHAFNGITDSAVNLFRGGDYTGTATYAVILSADATGTPGTVISILGGGNWADLGTSASGYWAQSGTKSFAQQAAGDYWLSVYTANGNSDLFRWSYGDNTNAGQTSVYNNDFQLWGYPAQNNSLGAYVNTTAVPEPGTLILSSLTVLYACGVIFFRKWRAHEIKTTTAH